MLYAHNAEDVFIPASATKLLTAAAALATLDPAKRFDTTVQRGTTENEIILVGGGDPLLTRDTTAGSYPPRASLAELADQTAEAVRRGREVVLRYDSTLFSGPATAGGWRPSYLSPGTAAVAPISALIVDGGRVGEPADRVRAADPAKTAAEQFAELLVDRGVRVSIRGPAKARDREPIASVSSPPVSALVEVMLTDSDNDVAEALARHVALARGEPATFAGAARAIAGTIAELGIDTTGLRLHDGSGLSRNNRITPRTLVELLSAASHRPDLRDVLTGLPVSGFTGTLEERPDGVTRNERAAGLVRAKTGTLLGSR